ncbi:hypothetical protein HYH03_002568 [Edaphochlamys debaryana]|uniref:Uncharacterized protein n=1 Tax=Edaphochlamys debaryana TaxID=47281 RepID=A0A836C5A2_9CHLO|nr:hypothetical protein HYH03_002568 [Edaphochlamys debaryana]|eukprot:KAG2499629.1 hypothetical protein HYH03_002568 [Edaphochlamys debaryana]
MADAFEDLHSIPERDAISKGAHWASSGDEEPLDNLLERARTCEVSRKLAVSRVSSSGDAAAAETLLQLCVQREAAGDARQVLDALRRRGLQPSAATSAQLRQLFDRLA